MLPCVKKKKNGGRKVGIYHFGKSRLKVLRYGFSTLLKFAFESILEVHERVKRWRPVSRTVYISCPRPPKNKGQLLLFPPLSSSSLWIRWCFFIVLPLLQLHVDKGVRLC